MAPAVETSPPPRRALNQLQAIRREQQARLNRPKTAPRPPPVDLTGSPPRHQDQFEMRAPPFYQAPEAILPPGHQGYHHQPPMDHGRQPPAAYPGFQPFPYQAPAHPPPPFQAAYRHPFQGFPSGAPGYGQSHLYPPPHGGLQREHASDREINSLLAMETDVQQGQLNRLQVLMAQAKLNAQKTKVAETARTSPVLRRYHLFGWAACPLGYQNYFDQGNHGAWNLFHNVTTKAGRIDCIETYFVPQLISPKSNVD